MIDINADLLQWFGNFSNKKISVGTVKNDNISNKELAKRIKQTNYQKTLQEKCKITFYG